MATGLVLSARPNAANVVDDVIERTSRAHQAGVQQIWLAQQFDHGRRAEPAARGTG